MLILNIFIVAGLIFFFSSVSYWLTKGKIFKRFYHDLLEWHIPNNEEGFDGCSFTSTCKICGKEIMQDSQGNWF